MPFDVAHFGSVCHWLAFPIAASYWEKQGQWNEAFVHEFSRFSQGYRSNERSMTMYILHRIEFDFHQMEWLAFQSAIPKIGGLVCWVACVDDTIVR